MTKLHDDMCRALIFGNEKHLDVITSVDVQIHNVVAEADTMEWQFDLKDMWLTSSRWSMMINQYLDPVELEAWIDKAAGTIGTRGRGIAVMRTKSVAARGGPASGNKETRRWGSCMLALSYKAKPAPQITLYSRTSYLGYIGALDLSVAWMCGRYLAAAMGIPLESIKFVWYNEAIQWHYFKSLAYLLNHENEGTRDHFRRLLTKGDKKIASMRAEDLDPYPALVGSRKWLRGIVEDDKAGITLGDMSYNTFRRIRRRYHTEVKGIDYARKFEGWSYYKLDSGAHKKGEQKEFFKAYGELPHCPIETLDFRRLGLPLAGVKEIEYNEVSDADEEDED